MKGNVRFWLRFVSLSIAGLALGMLLGRCIAPNPRTGTVDGNRFRTDVELAPRIDLAAVQAKIEELESEITGFVTGDIAIGGEGDNVTSWILAIGVIICTPAGGLFYQFVLRPMALPNRERKRQSQASAGETPDATDG